MCATADSNTGTVNLVGSSKWRLLTIFVQQQLIWAAANESQVLRQMQQVRERPQNGTTYDTFFLLLSVDIKHFKAYLLLTNHQV